MDDNRFESSARRDRARSVTLPTPSIDLVELTNCLGRAWGVTLGESLPQYLAWSHRIGLFKALDGDIAVTIPQICSVTSLNPTGADALLAILASLNLVHRHNDGSYELTPTSREYLLENSPYYVGHGLYLDCAKEVPVAYLAGHADATDGPPTVRGMDRRTWLRVQHARNFAAAVRAVRTGQFATVRHLLDVGGGTGVFAIPLAQDYPNMRITLVDLPEAVDAIREWLAAYNVDDRIQVVGKDIHDDDWEFEAVDAVMFGNIFHSYGDEICCRLAEKAFAAMSGGRVWLHEVMFNEQRDGPLIAALWNAVMVLVRKGAGQRTGSALTAILSEAGFRHFSCTPTHSGYSLLSGVKTR